MHYGGANFNSWIEINIRSHKITQAVLPKFALEGPKEIVALNKLLESKYHLVVVEHSGYIHPVLMLHFAGCEVHKIVVCFQANITSIIDRIHEQAHRVRLNRVRIKHTMFFNLSTKYARYVIQTVGRTHSAELLGELAMTQNTSSSMLVYWFPNNDNDCDVQVSLSSLHINLTKCHFLLPIKLLFLDKFTFAVDISKDSQSNMKELLQSHSSSLISWNMALKACGGFGGNLPIARNKREQNALTAVVKRVQLNTSLSVIELVFLGLHSHIQVSSTMLSFLIFNFCFQNNIVLNTQCQGCFD